MNVYQIERFYYLLITKEINIQKKIKEQNEKIETKKELHNYQKANYCMHILYEVLHNANKEMPKLEATLISFDLLFILIF